MNKPSKLRNKVAGADLVRIINSRFSILEALYPHNELTLTKIGEKIEMDIGNLSKQISGTDKIVGLSGFELPSGEFLIDVGEEEGERGRPRKQIKLTEAGRKIVSPLIETCKQKPKKNEPADTEEIDFYLNKMGEKSNDDERKIASKLFMKMCGESVVTHHKKALDFLKKNIAKPGFKIVCLNLLYSLHMIVQNTKDEKSLLGLEQDFKEPLKTILSETNEQMTDWETIRLYALETLCALLGDEARFKELKELYVNEVTKKSELTSNIRNMILLTYPKKGFEVKKALFEKLKDTNLDLRKRFRNELMRFANG